MQGSITQALALTVTGNAFVQGLEIGPFWPRADAFMFCSSVRFAAADGVIAANPDDWLQQLRRDSARLRLGVVSRNQSGISDREAVGFANGGPRWLIEVSQPGRPSTYWGPEWRVTGDPLQPPSDRRIWSVTYWRQSESSAAPDAGSLSKIVVELGETLDALAGMVQRAAPEEAMPGWADTFRHARELLDEHVGEYEAGDPGPEGFLSAEACRMLHACRAAWVFGGMGSWNDGAYWGSVEPEGDRLSQALFDLLQQGIVAAANSTARSACR